MSTPVANEGLVVVVAPVQGSGQADLIDGADEPGAYGDGLVRRRSGSFVVAAAYGRRAEHENE
jgi:hypothetical protein